MYRTWSRTVVAAAFAALIVSPAVTATVFADGHGRPAAKPPVAGILPPDATYRGLTYGDWLAIGWQELFSIAAAKKGQHPLTTGGAAALNNQMVLLSAPIVPLGTDAITIPVTIPQGQSLSVWMIAVECSAAEEPPFQAEGETNLRACANGLLDEVSVPDLHVEVDGTPVKRPGTYRSESPLFRYGPLPEGNALHLPAGTQADSVAAGYGVLLSPLGAGTHRIVVRASVPAFGIGVDTRFVVTVKQQER
jgi:hypothetical protein